MFSHGNSIRTYGQDFASPNLDILSQLQGMHIISQRITCTPLQTQQAHASLQPNNCTIHGTCCMLFKKQDSHKPEIQQELVSGSSVSDRYFATRRWVVIVLQERVSTFRSGFEASGHSNMWRKYWLSRIICRVIAHKIPHD